MKRTHTLFLLASGLTAACTPTSTDNPPTLWVAPNGDEAHLKLQPAQPAPF